MPSRLLGTALRGRGLHVGHPLFGEGSSQVQDFPLLDVIPLFMDTESVGGVMAKLIERNTTTLMMRNSDVHDGVPTISWVSSLSRRALWCSAVHSGVNLALLSACLHEVFQAVSFLHLSGRVIFPLIQSSKKNLTKKGCLI